MTFFDWLNLRPTAFQVFFVVAIMVFLIAVAYFIKTLLKGASVKVKHGDSEASINAEEHHVKDNQVEEDVDIDSPKRRKGDTAKILYKDIAFRDILRMLKLKDRISVIKYRLILADQMAFAEQKLDIIINDLRISFIQTLEAKMPDRKTLVESVGFKNYISALVIWRLDLIAIIKRVFVENHLSEKTDDEMRDYIKDRIEFFLAKGGRLLSESHLLDDTLDLPLLDRLHSSEVGILRDHIEEILLSAREISIRYEKEIKENEDEIITILIKYTHGDFSEAEAKNLI